MSKTTLKVTLVNTLILIFGLLVLEVMFGDWLIDNRLFFTRVPRDMILEMSVEHLYGKPGEKVSYSRDKYGFRGLYENLESIDILTVGGSTTDQRYIDNKRTWQEVLRKSFEEKYGRQVYIVNAGIDGQSTFGHIMNFDFWLSYIPRLQPDYILYYVGINDIHRVTLNEGYDDSIKPRIEGPLKSMVKPLIKKSALYNLWINLVGYSRRTGHVGHNSLDFSTISWKLEPILSNHTSSADLDSHLEQYALRLKELAKRTRAFGSEPIFVNQFTHKTQIVGESIRVPVTEISQVALGRFRLEYRYAAETMRVCVEVRAICVDLYTMLRKNMEDADYYDWAHNTPEGAEKIGRAIASVLHAIGLKGAQEDKKELESVPL